MRKTVSKYYILVVCLIFVTGAWLRVGNLKFNGLYADEAIYMVLGRLGVGAGDWYSYNPQSWVGGVVYFYPTVSGILSFFGNIYPRLLSGILGMILMFLVYKWVAPKSLMGAIAALWVVSLSAVVIFVSKLATYDMPSMLGVVMSFMALVSASDEKNIIVARKLLAVSSLAIVIAIGFKLIAIIFIPILVMYAVIISGYKKSFAMSLVFYWFAVIAIGVGFLWSISGVGLGQYISAQSSFENVKISEVVNIYWKYSGLALCAGLVGAVGLWWGKKRSLAICMTLMMMAPFLFHIYYGRITTLDKHSAYSVVVGAMMFGIGIEYWFRLQANAKVLGVLGLFFIMWINTYGEYNKLQELLDNWGNASVSNNYLYQMVNPGEKILTEVGPSSILALYDRIKPVEITTFDWIAQYQGYEGNEAYQEAVRDGYYHWIQLESDQRNKLESRMNLHKLIVDNFEDNYWPVHESEGYVIYKRIY